MGYARTLAVVTIFASAMGYLEAAVVVYLRAIYYPGGFSFPLAEFSPHIIRVELAREAATVVMLAAVSSLAGRSVRERFAWFILAFGVWDIVYYAGLKVVLGWPASLFDPDILFLIPVVWVGPVIAPVLVSAEMIVIGALLAFRMRRGGLFRPGATAWVPAVAATALILFTFFRDADAAAGRALPGPYPYPLLAAGLALYALAYAAAIRKRERG